MGKRKRVEIEDTAATTNGTKKSKEDANIRTNSSSKPAQMHVQIITGSYERILHGIIASIPSDILSVFKGKPDEAPKPTKDSSETMKQPTEDTPKSSISFADTFLFTAHTSSIRCLALSPPGLTSTKTLLATGSTDSRINLYTISTTPPPKASSTSKEAVSLPSLTGSKTLQNPQNKGIGTLTHHTSTITRLSFPSRGKLISSSEDNTIAITRVRDWTVLSTIRAPHPKAPNRPSGDTAAQGEAPSGINDFAVHPSSKVMISVGRGERCMRLWNLVTGKRAGVLQFERRLLEAVGEGGHFGSGEGRCVRWSPDGEEFVVGFERGVAVFRMDCRVRAVISLGRVRVQQIEYVDGSEGVVAVGTEDGRVSFFSTAETEHTDEAVDGEEKEKTIPRCEMVANLGGKDKGIIGRIKDFAMLPLPSEEESEFPSTQRLVITGSSDGAIRLWLLDLDDLLLLATNGAESVPKIALPNGTQSKPRQVGTPLGTFETGNRITCLNAFIMSSDSHNDGEEEHSISGAEDGEGSSSEESE